MKHITIIVPEGQNNLSSIVGAYKIFTRANAYWKDNGIYLLSLAIKSGELFHIWETVK